MGGLKRFWLKIVLGKTPKIRKAGILRKGLIIIILGIGGYLRNWPLKGVKGFLRKQLFP